MKKMVRMLLQVIDLFKQAEIVHCDFKPDNIIVKLSDAGEIENVKVIDFGSGFFFN